MQRPQDGHDFDELTPSAAGDVSVPPSGRQPRFRSKGADADCTDRFPPHSLERQVEYARALCLRLLTDRPRTRAELATALARRGISEEAATVVLDRFNEVGLIDDALFAKAWVSSRHHGRGLARRALGQELRRRGIDSELIGAALEELDPHTEEATARALVARKMRTLHGPPEATMRKLVGMLARKGYPPGLAFRVAKEAMEHAGMDADPLLDADEFTDDDS